MDKDGNVTHKYFIDTDGGNAAIHIKHQDAGAAIDPVHNETRYLHRDALGLIDTIIDDFGNVVERKGFAPFGEQKGGDWNVSAILSELAYTNRGFTGHERIDERAAIPPHILPILQRLGADPDNWADSVQHYG